MDFAQAKALFLAGVQAFEVERFEEAEQHFRASLALLPGRASTLTNLGATLLKRAQPEEALRVLQEALAAEPGNLDAWCHRGAAMAQLGRDEDALASYDRALVHAPLHPAALYHRAFTLNALQRPQDALETLEQYLALQPAHAPAWLLHGETLQALERHEAALGSYDKALAVDPALGEAWSRRGSLLRDARRLDEAAACFEKAIAHGADAQLNGYFLAALRGSATPPSAPARYVEFMFDGYADKFDDHLTQVLHYRAPRVLADGLAQLGRTQFETALDLGCGTGLCGPLVKPMARRLDGVDLSRNMLDKAQALGVYDALTQADIAAFLRDASQHSAPRYDLVVSADVFIYVGDLEAVFKGVRQAIASGGVFCFSAEEARQADGFALQPSLRYAHSEAYIRTLAQRHGFDMAQLVRHPIREDQRAPIGGLFAFLVAAS
jgi:predicted TPR repeat methyltransferase